jgi:hypothetical protein
VAQLSTLGVIRARSLFSKGMILMAIASSSSEVVGIIASLALLAPLVRALHRWHIDIRKTSKPADTATNRQSQSSTVSHGSRWSRMTGVDRLLVISNFLLYLTLGVALYWLAMRAEPHPATSKDVALVGLLVTMIVISSRLPDT